MLIKGAKEFRLHLDDVVDSEETLTFNCQQIKAKRQPVV